MNTQNTPPPIRSVDSLVEAMQKGERPKWLFFWGHSPRKDGRVSSTCFSQWWSGHPYEIDGVRYATAEHWMMAEKARLFHDEATLAKVLAAPSAAQAKALGRKVTPFDENQWLAARWDIVVNGNFAKFSQHDELRTFLLETGDKVIVEASPFDRIWGIGMGATDERVEKPQEWKGLNLLGFALMEVRKRMQQAE